MKKAILRALVMAVICLSCAQLLFGADAKPEDPATAAEPIFPGGVSPYLALFGEPPLGKWPESEARYSISADRYRMTRLQQGALLCIRVFYLPHTPNQKPPESGPQIVIKRGFFDQPDSKGILVPATFADLKVLLDAFREEELFSLPPRREISGASMDGHTWVFERWQLGRYRVVARSNPEGGPAKASAVAVLEFLERIQKPK